MNLVKDFTRHFTRNISKYAIAGAAALAITFLGCYDNSNSGTPSSTQYTTPAYTASRTQKPTPRITRTPQPTATPSPTPSPTVVPIAVPTPEPTQEPIPIDLSICQPDDLYVQGEIYAAPDVGTRMRIYPFMESDYNGRAAQNTKLAIECQRSVDNAVWYRVTDSAQSFWIPDVYTSTAPLSVAAQVPVDTPPPAVAPGGGNKIVLTFDDSGPQAWSILDILAQYEAKGIFFPNGSFAAGNPDLIQRMYNEGHMVCNHTRDHADLTTLSYEGVRDQILGGAGVGSCNLLRPPYGAYNSSVASVAAELGYSIYMWDIDTRDWARRYAGGDQEILSIVLSQAYPGATVLMHMHVDNTVYALPAMLQGLKDAGYELHW